MDGFGATGFNEQSVLAVLDEVRPAGARRAKDGYSTGHGLKDDEAEAFRDGGQGDEVALFHVSGQGGIGESPANLDVDAFETSDEVPIHRGAGIDDELSDTLRERGQGCE